MITRSARHRLIVVIGTGLIGSKWLERQLVAA
jgi:hypothetical protein